MGSVHFCPLGSFFFFFFSFANRQHSAGCWHSGIMVVIGGSK